MTIHYLEKQASLTGSSTQDSLGVVAARLKGLLSKDPVDEERMSYWQLILSQSKANGCFYRGKDLPHNLWAWPKHTWFQKRLSHYLEDPEFAVHESRN